MKLSLGRLVFKWGENRDRLPSHANNVGSVSKCARSGESDRDGHLTCLSAKQPTLSLGKKKKDGGVMGNSHVPFLDLCPKASCHLLFGQCLWRHFSVVIPMHFHSSICCSGGDAQEESSRGCTPRKSWNLHSQNEKGQKPRKDMG